MNFNQVMDFFREGEAIYNGIVYPKDSPRITDKGCLLEGYSENILLHSNNLMESVWNPVNVVESSGTYSFSNGSVEQTSSDPCMSVSLQYSGDGYIKLSSGSGFVEANGEYENKTLSLRGNFSSVRIDADGEFNIHYVQAEDNIPTSGIITTDAPKARNQEYLLMKPEYSWWNKTHSTFIIDAEFENGLFLANTNIFIEGIIGDGVVVITTDEDNAYLYTTSHEKTVPLNGIMRRQTGLFEQGRAFIRKFGYRSYKASPDACRAMVRGSVQTWVTSETNTAEYLGHNMVW